MADEPQADDSARLSRADDSARLSRAGEAYDVGDFVAVRDACALLRSAGDRELAARAAELAAKVAVEPTSWFAVACCCALLVGVVVTYAY